ncbi:hypothetical protein BDB01DRAFT_833211 [Pilobolus umbonatus]|nr:hypothetical protein BDB01DRAFT_833211 [Pilobolus umbonatus]
MVGDHDLDAVREQGTWNVKCVEQIQGPFIKPSSWLLVSNPPYSPEFSPTVQFWEDLKDSIRRNFTDVDLSMKEVSNLHGLKPVHPQGAMYMMVRRELVKLRDINSDIDFSSNLSQKRT